MTLKDKKSINIIDEEKKLVYTHLNNWIKTNKTVQAFNEKIEIKYTCNLYLTKPPVKRLNVVINDGIYTTQWGWKSSKKKEDNLLSLSKFLEEQYISYNSKDK